MFVLVSPNEGCRFLGVCKGFVNVVVGSHHVSLGLLGLGCRGFAKREPAK